jgi:mRNA interferase HigB
MWILEERTLKVFWRLHPGARRPLVAWLKEIEAARWETPAEVRARYRSADFVKDKVVFDIGGNKYRLVVRFAYADRLRKPPLNGIAWVLFIGTHKQYDEIDVTEL